jgi:elongator complex protein 5
LTNVDEAPNIIAFDFTGRIPGYDDLWCGPQDEILARINSVPPGSLNVIIDSVDTLTSDLGSTPKTYKFIRTLLGLLTARSEPSILVLHLQPSPLLELLTQISLSPTLMHLTAHPPAIITHIASAYLTHPPPAGSAEKFWSVFIPFSERTHESERLVYGLDGNGTSTGALVSKGMREFVVEVIIRGGSKRGVERTVEGWKGDLPCELQALESLKSIWTRRKPEEARPDPTQNVSFNLNLTPSQEKSRAQVPLPYAHEGNPVTTVGAILYDPDSADDIDDDDPDEDLDI